MLNLASYSCEECGLLVRLHLTPDPDTEPTADSATYRVDRVDHDCRPHLLGFFNPDSFHQPPFTR